MAFAHLGGTANGGSDNVGGVTYTPAAVEYTGGTAGTLVTISISSDNLSTTDGDNTEVLSVVDSVGNVYTKAVESTNGNGAAAAGATVSIWYAVLVTTTTYVGTTVTFTFSGSTAMRAWRMETFSRDTSKFLYVDQVGSRVDDVADAGSITLTPGKGNIEYLFIRADAHETASTTYTPSTNYTDVEPLHATTTGVPDAANMGASQEYRVFTTGSAESTNPACTAVDHASAMVSFYEVAPVTSPVFGGRAVRLDHRVKGLVGPPVLMSQRSDYAFTVATNNYTLVGIVPNLTFTGGTHSLLVTRQLIETKANITFTGGAHSLKAGRLLTETKDNITFTGGSHSLIAGRSLVETKANITFTGGSHTLVATHALTTVKANITFTGGSHSLAVGRVLTETKANISFTGGAHSLAAGRSLVETKANITFTGGSHTLTSTAAQHITLTAVAPNITFTGGAQTLAAGRSLIETKANITFTGGAHNLTVGRKITAVTPNITFTGGNHTLATTATQHFTLTTVAPNLTLTGGQHTLTYLPFGTSAGGGGTIVWGHPQQPLPTLPEDYELKSVTPEIRFKGGRHSFELGRDPLLDDAEALLVLA